MLFELGRLLGSFATLAALLFVFASLFCSVCIPFLAFAAVRHLKGIREELARLNQASPAVPAGKAWTPMGL